MLITNIAASRHSPQRAKKLDRKKHQWANDFLFWGFVEAINKNLAAGIREIEVDSFFRELLTINANNPYFCFALNNSIGAQDDGNYIIYQKDLVDFVKNKSENILRIFDLIGGFTLDQPKEFGIDQARSRLDELLSAPSETQQDVARAVDLLVDDALHSPTPRLAQQVIDAAQDGGWTARVVAERSAVPLNDRPTLPPQAPALWSEQKQKGDTPVTFIERHYAPWLGKGLSRPDIRRLDPQLYMALANWLRKNELPDGFELPTRREENDNLLEQANIPKELLRRAAGAAEWRHKKQRIVD